MTIPPLLKGLLCKYICKFWIASHPNVPPIENKDIVRPDWDYCVGRNSCFYLKMPRVRVSSNDAAATSQ